MLFVFQGASEGRILDNSAAARPVMETVGSVALFKEADGTNPSTLRATRGNGFNIRVWMSGSIWVLLEVPRVPIVQY